VTATIGAVAFMKTPIPPKAPAKDAKTTSKTPAIQP